MELTLEVLEAKRQEHINAIKVHETAMNASYGAMRVLDELIAVAKAEKPKASEK